MRPSKQSTDRKAPVAGRLQQLNGKTAVAVVLVSVMALLWGRVLLLGKSGPAEASAAESAALLEQAVPEPAEPVGEFVPRKLDMLEGRHDVLAADMFSTERMAVLADRQVIEPDPQPAPTPETDRLAGLEKIAQTLRLEAVIRNAEGRPCQAFVNDAIYTVGSVLTVNEGPEAYELVLRKISENEAVFVWNSTSITLKMTETVDK